MSNKNFIFFSTFDNSHSIHLFYALNLFSQSSTTFYHIIQPRDTHNTFLSRIQYQTPKPYTKFNLPSLYNLPIIFFKLKYQNHIFFQSLLIHLFVSALKSPVLYNFIPNSKQSPIHISITYISNSI